MFKLNKADYNYHLQSARLTVGNGIYYPEIEYSYANIARIFKAVNNYAYKQNDKNTVSLLNMKNYMIPTSWTYLWEMFQTLNNIKHVDNNFRISPSILNPQYVFVLLQRSDKMDNQYENPYLFNTSKSNAADNDECHW